jgi:hypothetical protein
MRHQTLAAATPPRPQHPRDPMHTTRPCPTPRTQHPRAARAADLTGHQPRLDSNRIRLYRHQRCLRASARPSRHRPPRHDTGGPLSSSSARFSRSRHSDDADHHNHQPEQDQTLIGNRPDANQPSRRR